MSIFATVQGLAIGFSMIIPIGAQNAFVLNQGIKHNHHLLAASICMLCDFSLIVLGIYGGGKLISQSELLLTIITWAGIIFLSVYGFISFKAVFKETSSSETLAPKIFSFKVVVLTTLAVTLLNPHVYLDTVVILGSVGSQFAEEQRGYFTFGLMLASLIWFYGLAIGAAKLSPVLSRKKTKQTIDFVVGLIMWLVALSLFWMWWE